MKPNKPVQRISNKNRLTGKRTMKPNKWVKFIWGDIDVIVKEKDANEFKNRLIKLDRKIKSLN